MSSGHGGESGESRTDRLAAEIADLRARQDILDCVARYARGADRHDEEILLSALHPDALARYGNAVHTMPEFAAELNAGHESWTRAHTHNITTHTCEITGDEAHTETYVLAGLAAADTPLVRLYGARYVDRLARRDARWRILRRLVMIDWVLVGDGGVFDDPAFRARGYPAGSWDRSDPSYRRPFEPDGARRSGDGPAQRRERSGPGPPRILRPPSGR